MIVVELLLCVLIIRIVLFLCAFRYGLAPLSSDYLQPSEDELRIELYQGSVTEKDARLRGFDLVTSIEL